MDGHEMDYWAGLAMQALIAKMPIMLHDGEDEETAETICRIVARGAWMYADAMRYASIDYLAEE